MSDLVRQAWREIGRAPARILTSVFALALAIGAIGVFAIPAVSTSSLRDAAERDGIPQIVLRTSSTAGVDIDSLLSKTDNVERAEPQLLSLANLGDGDALDILGLDIGDQQTDIVRADVGRLPRALGELLVTEGTADVGDEFDAVLDNGDLLTLSVVGIGGTAFWNDGGMTFSDLETAALVEGFDGPNRIVVTTTEKGQDALRTTANEIRAVLADAGIEIKTLPFTIPNGRHPVEADIEQVSSLIGLLGVVAGLVALVLLGSTANTLIAERTREVAVMRALGATNRSMRRRLRRLALWIAGAAVVIGVPLGVLISNVIARMVMNEFVGMTPGFAVSVPVMLASAAFALVGARTVAAGAARRVTKQPLAEALRDREGSPFGRRLSERLVARVAAGSLLDRTAVRNGVHQRSRSVAMLSQITAAVAALMIIASMATTINDFNAETSASVQWTTRSFVPGPGLDISTSVADGDPAAEVGSAIDGEVEGWGIEVYGFVADTQMFDRGVDAGRWFSGPREVVVASGFADQVGIDLGDQVDVELGSGQHTYTVVGLHPDRDRSIFVDVEELATDMNLPGMGNVVMSTSSVAPALLDGPVEVERFDPDESDNGTAAILVIFTAIGAVVVSVAGLAVASGLAVNVFERRHQFAALRALGGRRRHVLRVVVAELLPLASGGILLGLVAGYFGARAIARSFEAQNALEIGFVFATGAIPVAAGVVLVGVLLIGLAMVRQVTREPAAVTLRGAP